MCVFKSPILPSARPLRFLRRAGAAGAMFEVLRETKLETITADVQGPYTVIPGPPAGWVPPIGASANTWANIYKNKQRIDYCVDQFAYLTNRVKCVQKFTVGPFLA